MATFDEDEVSKLLDQMILEDMHELKQQLTSIPACRKTFLV
jgi:hypothetical protein